MNWFTKSIIAASDDKYKQAKLDEDGGCEHVEKEVNLAYAIHRENDSFGVVGSWVCCKPCHEAAAEAEGLETEVCKDCSQPVAKKDGFFWRWYDFYAPQGDEALFICKACSVKPNHLQRVARDKAAREDEYGDDY
jgi:hypothetical protein